MLLLSLFVLVNVFSASPVFEPENLVEVTVPDDAGFERSNDGFADMNDFNFEPSEGIANKEQDSPNQSAEQQGDDEGGPPQSARERPSLGEMNKATAEEQEGNEEDGSGETQGRPSGGEAGARKQKYQDGDEANSARSLDQFEPFDKEDKEVDNLDKNEFNENGPNDGSSAGTLPNSAEDQGPRGSHLPMPPPPLQIDEPIIVNGPIPPMQMHGGRPPMMDRSNGNSEENEGESDEEELEPSMREYMNQWISNFERDPSLLNALTGSVQNLNYGVGGESRR